MAAHNFIGKKDHFCVYDFKLIEITGNNRFVEVLFCYFSALMKKGKKKQMQSKQKQRETVNVDLE